MEKNLDEKFHGKMAISKLERALIILSFTTMIGGNAIGIYRAETSDKIGAGVDWYFGSCIAGMLMIAGGVAKSVYDENKKNYKK